MCFRKINMERVVRSDGGRDEENGALETRKEVMFP